MKKVVAEKYRDIDFSRAKRGAIVKPEPGKTKISIRLDNLVLEYFRSLVEAAGGGTTRPSLMTPCLNMFIAARLSTSCAKRSEKNSLPTASPVDLTKHPSRSTAHAADRHC